MVDSRFAYLLFSLVFLILWCFLFAMRRDLRRPMLITSILVAPLGPISEVWYLVDYWRPQTITGTTVGIEDVIVGFALGGIALALYPSLANLVFVNTETSGFHVDMIVAFSIGQVGTLIIATGLLHLNSILSSVIGFVLTAIYGLYRQRSLVPAAVVSGMLSWSIFAVVYQILPIVQMWCTTCNPTGIHFFGINLEEMLWDGTWGFVGGILFPATMRYSLQPRSILRRTIGEQSGAPS